MSYLVSHYIIATKRVLRNEIVFHGVQKNVEGLWQSISIFVVFFSLSFVPFRPKPSKNLIWPMAMLNGSECKNVHIIRTRKKNNNELIWKIDISNSVSVCLLFFPDSPVLPPKSILMEVIIRLAKRERERERDSRRMIECCLENYLCNTIRDTMPFMFCPMFAKTFSVLRWNYGRCAFWCFSES